jgi:hypothetical protein
MFSRSELEYKIKVCNAQTSLRVVAFSILLIVPIWIGAALTQKFGWTRNLDVIRPIGAILLLIYALGIYRIIKRTQEDHGLACPKCRSLLGLRAEQCLRTKTCPSCHEKIVQ